jgi:peptide/nickel transport system permease protein
MTRTTHFALALFGAFLLMGLLGPYLVPYDPREFVAVPNLPPSAEHWFGTTGQGQDVLSQTIAGARMSLFMGLFVGVAVTIVAALVGTTAGYFRGVTDDLLSLLINVFLILPGLPLAVVMGAYLPSGPWTLMLVLTVTGWSWGARVMRSQALSLRRRDFVAAAIVAGESHLSVICREMVPNLRALLTANFIGATTYAVGAQVGLEFLGLGDLDQVTWGTNLYWASNNGALLTESWWTFVPTGFCLALVAFSLALLNMAADAWANPRLRIPKRRQKKHEPEEARAKTEAVKAHAA